MSSIYFLLVAKLGIPLALTVIEKLGKATTNEEAILALRSIMTAQEYVDADAKLRGIESIPLPKIG